MPDWAQDLMIGKKWEGVMKHFFSKPYIDSTVYNTIHSDLEFRPLNFTVDLEKFNSEVISLKDKFESWGVRKTELSRKGLALTDTKTKVKHDYESGPANWPLDVWNWYHPDKPLADVDFDQLSKYARHFESLKEIMDTFAPYLGRTNVTWWNNGDHFTKHFDVSIERPVNYRLWMSNHTGHEHELWMGGRDKNDPMTQISLDMEPGRLYLIDTSRYHAGGATVNNVFSLLVTLKPSATDLLYRLLT